MTKLASYRHLVPALFALGWLGCTGSNGPGETLHRSGAGGVPESASLRAGPSWSTGPADVGFGGSPAFGGSPGFGGSSTMCFNSGVGPTVTTGVGGVTGRGSSTQFPPQLGTTYSQPAAPPAISGGTLLVLSDGKTAVAADPDRDAIYVVDLSSRTVTQTIALQPGDEPGRLVQDAAGRVHVALRRGGAIVTCDPATGKVLARRPVCAAPRGLAYEPGADRVHVACHDGQLVSLPAAGGDAVRRLQLDDDLRDVLVDGNNLLVTRFRSAELLTVGADGTVTGRVQPPAFTSKSGARWARCTPPSVAWRALPAPGGGTLVLHQRGTVDPVVPTAGGYGGPSPCDAIVHHCITRIDRDGTTRSGPALASLVLAVDMAVSPDGKQVAVVSAGNATNGDIAAIDDLAGADAGVLDGSGRRDRPADWLFDGRQARALRADGGARPWRIDASTGAGGATRRGRRRRRQGGVPGTGGAAGPCCAPPSTGGAGGTGGRRHRRALAGRRLRQRRRLRRWRGDRDRGQRRRVHAPSRRACRSRWASPSRSHSTDPAPWSSSRANPRCWLWATAPPSRCRRSAAPTRATPCSTPTRAGSWRAPRATRKATRTDGPGTSAARGRAARNRSRLGWPAPSHSTGTATRPTSRTS